MSKYSQVLDEKQLAKFLDECEEYQVSTGTGSPSDKQIAEEQLATLAAYALPELVQEVRELRAQLAQPSAVVCSGKLIFNRRVENKIHCRTFKWNGLKPVEALNQLVMDDANEGKTVRVTVEVVEVPVSCATPTVDSLPAPVRRGEAVLGTITCIPGAAGAGLLYFGRPAIGPATGNGWDTPERAVQDVVDWAEGRQPQYVKHCQEGGEGK